LGDDDPVAVQSHSEQVHGRATSAVATQGLTVHRDPDQRVLFGLLVGGPSGQVAVGGFVEAGKQSTERAGHGEIHILAQPERREQGGGAVRGESCDSRERGRSTQHREQAQRQQRAELVAAASPIARVGQSVPRLGERGQFG